MKRLLVVLLCVSTLAGAGAQTRSPKLVPRVEAALAAEKLDAKRRDTDEWWVFVTVSGERRFVEVLPRDESVTVRILVALGRPFSNAEMQGLLEANSRAKFAKLAIEAHDLLAISHLPKDFTSAHLKTAIEDVTVLANEAAKVIGPTR